MFRKRRLVYLPKVIPALAMEPSLADFAELVIDAGDLGVTTLEAQQAGYLNPTKAVCELRMRGALIRTERCQATGSTGKLHRGIARYIYSGWDSATEWDDLTSVFLEDTE